MSATNQPQLTPDLGAFFNGLVTWINLTPGGPFGPSWESNAAPFKAVFCPDDISRECSYAYGEFDGVQNPSALSGKITMLVDNLHWSAGWDDAKPFGAIAIITAGNATLRLRTVELKEELILSVPATSDTEALDVSLTSFFWNIDHLVASGHSNRSETVSVVLNKGVQVAGVIGG